MLLSVQDSLSRNSVPKVCSRLSSLVVEGIVG